MDEKFYEVLETVFEDVLQLVKEYALKPDLYKERFNALLEATQNVGWGYGDQIEMLLDAELPGIFN